MVKLNAYSVMEKITENGALTLLALAFLSFIAIGIFSVDYYDSLFSTRFGIYSIAMAILVASIQELVRFGLLVVSIKDFNDNKHLNGWLGLAGSISLVIHDVKLSWQIALMWTSTEPTAYYYTFLLLIAIGLLLELRLVLTVAKGKKSKTLASKKYQAKSQLNGVGTAVNN